MLRGVALARIGLLVALAPGAAAHAIDTHLNGNAQAGSLVGAFQVFEDVPTAELTGLQQQDAFANDAVTHGLLATPTGRFTLSTHACSGGAPPAFGSASGAANAGVAPLYVVASSTLPPGTPVQID